jgi:hypothetical protein
LKLAPIGFAAAFGECFGAVLPALPKRRGRRPRVPLAQVLPALVFHVMNTALLAEHFAQIFDDTLADSSLGERRTRLPREVFTELMCLGLRALAQLTAHPDAFWRGWWLVALDGTQFSLTNTPQVKASAHKAKGRRGHAAFAKLTTDVLLKVYAWVQRPGHRAQELRFWTSLLDPKSAPAQEMVELYARRWEHELYYRELKRQLRKNEVLQSHTVETGAQEIAAGGAGQRVVGVGTGASRGGRGPGAASELRQDAGVDAAPGADVGAGRRPVERAPEGTTDRTISGAGWTVGHSAPTPAAQLPARSAPTGERLAAAAARINLGKAQCSSHASDHEFPKGIAARRHFVNLYG